MLKVFWLMLAVGAQAREESWSDDINDPDNCVLGAEMDQFGGEKCRTVETGRIEMVSSRTLLDKNVSGPAALQRAECRNKLLGESGEDVGDLVYCYKRGRMVCCLSEEEQGKVRLKRERGRARGRRGRRKGTHVWNYLIY